MNNLNLNSLNNLSSLSNLTSLDNGIFTVASSGKVSVDFLYDGGWYQGELAMFSLERMENLEVN